MKKPAKTTEAKAAGGRTRAELTAKTHPELFAEAMKCFTARSYREAAALFEAAAAGPLMSVNESAEMYRRMCMKRLEVEAVQLQTPEDLYNYGVSLLNAGNYEAARNQLELAVARSSSAHYLYALALAEGKLGLVAEAAQHLRKSTQADPVIRSVARGDEDFAPLLEHAAIREALGGEPT
jgi:tetratricopeptide (TPR) repeat protein